jgi:alkanesulfonate monooxygenase SsuD/methylene tetrahydromethanopterin reductase-like flavin-dependent oxidoreductase (luciferase family)
VVAPLRIGFGVPRYVGEPGRGFSAPDHRRILRYAQRAEQVGFDSVWVPDHFYFEWPPGVFEPYPEAWTLMTAIGATTRRALIGSLVLAAGFRHPALLAKMAGALQELTGGRLLLGVGAGNQAAEHMAFGLGFDGRVGRFAEYVAVLHRLVHNQRVTHHGRHYRLSDASLLMSQPAVPIWIAASGERMLSLTARYADGWNGGGGLSADGRRFRAGLDALRAACRQIGRDPNDLEVSCSASVLVLPSAAEADAMLERVAAAVPGWTPQTVRERYAVGTPEQVSDRLAQALEWGATHLICSMGGRPFTLWSDDMLELFVEEVMPRVRRLAQ